MKKPGKSVVYIYLDEYIKLKKFGMLDNNVKYVLVSI